MRHNQSRRSRGRSGRKGPNPLTRSYESNGPDVKVRGTPAHIAEKYMALARDAQASGDIVAAENYFQHAEHYNRIIAAAQAQAQQGQQEMRQQRDGGEDEGYDGERQMNGRGVDFSRDDRDQRDEQSAGDGDGQEVPVAQQQPQQAAEPERPRRRRRPRSEDGAEAPAPRRRGGEKSAASSNGAGEGESEEDTTQDGQAALAAFPD